MFKDADIHKIKDSKITAHQLLIAQLICQRNFALLSDYLNAVGDPSAEGDFSKLVSAGWITLDENYKGSSCYRGYQATEKASSLFSSGDEMWNELLDEFPVKVVRTDGSTDYLRRDLERCKKIYKKIVGADKEIHLQIINCLKFEKNKRERESSWGYMKRLPKWLASQEWKAYEEEISDIFNTKSQELNLVLESELAAEGGMYGCELA